MRMHSGVWAGDMISMLMSSYITVIKKIFATSNMNKIVICKDR